MSTCFFIGHRDAPDSLRGALLKEVERHVEEYGVTEFVVGSYGRFDGTFYPPGMEAVPKRAAIVRANRYMADHSEYLIAYAWCSASNARNLVEYAQKRSTVHITILTAPQQSPPPSGRGSSHSEVR